MSSNSVYAISKELPERLGFCILLGSFFTRPSLSYLIQGGFSELLLQNHTLEMQSNNPKNGYLVIFPLETNPTLRAMLDVTK